MPAYLCPSELPNVPSGLFVTERGVVIPVSDKFVPIPFPAPALGFILVHASGIPPLTFKHPVVKVPEDPCWDDVFVVVSPSTYDGIQDWYLDAERFLPNALVPFLPELLLYPLYRFIAWSDKQS